MSVLPPSFLFRVSYPCLRVAGIPRTKGEELLGLPEKSVLPDLCRLQDKPGFAEVRAAWNEEGLAFEVRVKGKDLPVRGEEGKPRSSDGLALWIDTRSVRDSHRASRYCHHFYFLAAGSGEDGESPSAGMAKIHRAQADAPLCKPEQLLVRKHMIKSGYRLECFIPAEVLAGFDVELNNQFGFYYVVRDGELGEQPLSVGSEFPYSEDPSLWQVLELMRK